MAENPPNSLEEVRVDAEIGDDPQELKEMADAVVRGCSIRCARIKSLRALIEAVHAHTDAKIAPLAERRDNAWSPPPEDSPDRLTELSIYGGECVGDGNCHALDIRITLKLRTHFDGSAIFNHASFGGDAIFNFSSFGGDAWFHFTNFDGHASFHDASFGGRAIFNFASFCDDVWFQDASINGEAWFEDARFSGDVIFNAVNFAGHVYGDMRPCFLRTALFAQSAIRVQQRHAQLKARKKRRQNLQPPSNLRDRIVRLVDQLAEFRDELNKRKTTHWLATSSDALISNWPRSAWSWLRYELGWRTVRVLGQLQILNRISVITLITVPVLAALTAALQAQVPQWPPLGTTMAWAFFAAVFFTLGQLVYQIAVPDCIRKHDEDEFIDLQHKRYHEKAEDRDDGLRRAIDHLEAIAKQRPDRHANFVSHHGDTIWIPPRDRIDWFENWTSPVEARQSEDDIDVRDHTSRMNIVPGAERRRITIEEGAKAEYAIKSRDKLFAAWLSVGLYSIGIGCLLVILVLQSYYVGQAVGWWGVE